LEGGEGGGGVGSGGVCAAGRPAVRDAFLGV
jgi:hypothetical protein